jgi:hypothetical protein
MEMSKAPSGESGLHRLLVHRSRSIEWKPVGIHCMALSLDTRFVLIGKSSGDIELWEVGKNEIGLLSVRPLSFESFSNFVLCFGRLR